MPVAAGRLTHARQNTLKCHPTPPVHNPALRQAFTYDGKFCCAPKDFSTLALRINTTAWSKAGLTDAD
ncbi:hypothetical protein [Streptomyces flaveus]|uniref:hypothetical protein n=1 Tax=Streptomyces flaveus TaxID=66370 RepID=UPI00332F2A47